MAETPKPGNRQSAIGNREKSEIRNRNPEGGYETRDLGFRAVLTFLVFLLAAMVVFMLITLGIYRILVPPKPPGATAPSRWAEVRPLPPPTEPRLQANPAKDITEFYSQENQMLRSYGWVNQNAGTLRIPINRAMELMIERGILKSRQQAANQAAGSGQQASEENPQSAIPNPQSEGGGSK